MKTQDQIIAELNLEKANLRAFLRGCSTDMSEAGEIGVTAKVTGRRLDGIVVHIGNGDYGTYAINLEILIAMARLG